MSFSILCNKSGIHFEQLHSEQAVREAATICHRPLQVDLLPFDLESGFRVTCDVGHLCADFSLPRPLCSRLRPDVRDRRQTSDRRQTRIIAYCPYHRGRGIINEFI